MNKLKVINNKFTFLIVNLKLYYCIHVNIFACWFTFLIVNLKHEKSEKIYAVDFEFTFLIVNLKP